MGLATTLAVFISGRGRCYCFLIPVFLTYMPGLPRSSFLPHGISTALLPHPYPVCCPLASTLSFRSPLLAFSLLSGDFLVTFNIRSILHPLLSAALSDLIDSHNPDLFCLTETSVSSVPPPTFSTVHHHTTQSALFIRTPTRPLPLAAAPASSFVNPSLFCA